MLGLMLGNRLGLRLGNRLGLMLGNRAGLIGNMLGAKYHAEHIK